MEAYQERLRLIEYLYQVAIDPLCYDNLLDQWDKVISHTIGEGSDIRKDRELVGHINRADAILNQLENLSDDPACLPIAQAIALDPNPALTIAASAKIVDVNDISREQFGIDKGLNLLEFLAGNTILYKNLKRLIALLNQNQEVTQGIVGLLELESLKNNETVLFAMTRIQCKSDPDVRAMITLLAPVWSDNLVKAVQTHFNLTRAEIEVVRELVNGKNANTIARKRETSIHTVRAQVKSILQKTEMESQTDLVRHIGFLQRYEQSHTELSNGAKFSNSSVADRFITRDGRNLEYVKIGPRSGTPVLYLHGMVDSTEFTDKFLRQLVDRNILVIAPSRPGFGNSDPRQSYDDTPEKFAHDADELLDHLGISRLTVVGHMAGALYAFALAAIYPRRICSIVTIAGAVPMVSNNQFKNMTPIQRLGGMTARHAPHLFSIFIRGGIALVRRGREDILLQSAYKNAPVDMEVARKPAMRTMLYRRYHFLTDQGPYAFQNDAMQISRDWSYLVTRVKCPLTLVHGRHDQVIHIESVVKFARKTGAKLVISPDSGQLVLASDPDLVLDAIELQ